LLSDTHDRVEAAQRVLSGVEHGLEVAEKAEAVARRTRPILRWMAVVILGCLVGLAIALVIGRTRDGGDGATPEDDGSEWLREAREETRDWSA
jgi:hypothetical protein